MLRHTEPQQLANTLRNLQGLQGLRNLHIFNNSHITYRNALAYMLKNESGIHLDTVFLEQDFCLACFYSVRYHPRSATYRTFHHQSSLVLLTAI